MLKTISTRPYYYLVLIIFVAVVLRVVAAIFLGNSVIDLPGTFDQLSYNTLAQRVLAGHGFSFAREWWPATAADEPTAHWSFLYTLYLAVIYGLFGYEPLIARLVQAIIAGVFMPWLVYSLGQRHFGVRSGLVAAAITAVYAYFIYYAATLMTETFYIISILWTLNLAGELGQIHESTPHAVWKSLALGTALAITVLLRQVFLLFIPILFIWLLWRRYKAVRAGQDNHMHLLSQLTTRPMQQMMGILAGATLILILAIAPWSWRNYQVFGSFVLLNTNAGFAFFWGNHPIHGTNFISILPADGPSYYSLIPPELLTLNEAELEKALLVRGIAFVQTDPGRYILLSLSRIKDYFQFWPSAESGLISNISRLVSFGLMWPFMAYGFLYHARRAITSELLILYLFVLFYTAIHLLTWALVRYRLPIDAILLPFAAYSLLALADRFGWKLNVMPTILGKRQLTKASKL